jgi:hypothetical protein
MSEQYSLIKLRRGTTVQLEAVKNTLIPSVGEPIVEFATTGTYLKIGDGIKDWEHLSYIKVKDGDTPIDLSDYAKKDLSNVGEFNISPNGVMFYKDDGILKKAPITIDNIAKIITSEYSMKIPPNSIYFGLNTSIHENGGYLEYNTKTLDKNYILLDYENNPDTGSKRPIYAERSAKELKDEIQPIADTLMNGVTVVNIGHPQFDRQVQSVYFNFHEAVTNLKLMLNINGNNVADYPSGSWDNDNVGFNLGTGLQKIDFTPYFSSLVEYDIKVFVKADNPINVMGNGTLPYLAYDINRITRKNIALVEDITGTGGFLKKDFSNCDEKALDRAIKLTDVYKELENRFPTYYGIKAIERDVTQAFDFSTTQDNLIHIVYHIDSQGKTINQTLPILSNDKVIICEVVYDANIDNGKVVISPNGSDKINNDIAPIEINKSGVSGIFIGTDLYWDYIPPEIIHDNEIIVSDGMETLNTKYIEFNGRGVSVTQAGVKAIVNIIGEDTSQTEKNTNELNRINAIMNEDIFSGSFKGDITSIIDDTKAYSGYFVTTYAVDASKNIVTLPNHADIQNGTVFCIDNQDVNSDIMVKPPTGETIDTGTLGVNVPSGNILFLSKDGTKWVTGFGGFLPSSISRLIADIKIAIPNIGQGGLTIEQIEAKLKDKLKTTSQIAQEFKDQLHTIDSLRFAEGMAWAFAEYDFTDDIADPYHDFKSMGRAILDQKTDIVSPNTPKYLRMRLPQYCATLVQYVRTGADPRNDMVSNVINYDETKDVVYAFFYFTTPIPANTQIKLHFDFYNKFPQPVASGITIQGDETTELFTGITDAYYPNSIVEVNPNDSKEALITPYVKVVVPAGASEEPQPPAEYKTTAIKLTDGLEAYSDPDVETGVVMGIKHNHVEQKHNPGFLAYLSVPNRIKRLEVGEESYRKFAIAFKHDDIHVPPDGVGIKYTENTDVFGIEEYDGLDPNTSDGTDFFTIFRTSFGGNAPSDGFIRTMLIKDTATVPDTDDDTYIKDVSGNIIANEKTYKQGDKLGVLETVGVINAKELKNFKLVVITNITGDDIYFTAKENGRTGLMIQALTSTEKTGLALLQYENDTQQDINFTGMYLANDRATLKRDLTENTTVRTVAAGTSNDDFAGWGYYALTQNTISITDNALAIDGDFSLHHIFGADETQACRNKQIKVTTTLLNPQTSYTVALAKHVEIPDEYNKNIFISRSQGGGVIAQGGWAIDFTTQQIINSGSLTDFRTVEKIFTIPNDANNYAILLYPETDFGSAEIKLKEFKVDVVNPFKMYYIHSTKEINELSVLDVERFKTFIQNKQSYYSLRYTLTNHESPMPCGEPRFGNANVVVDPTVNIVQGSSARGGEGALKFLLDGSVEIRTAIRISNEKDANYNARWWFARVSTDGLTYTKIDASETTVLVAKDSVGTLFNMKPFRIEVEAGDRIALRSQTDIVDGAYIICTDDSKPMIVCNLDFDEVITLRDNDAQLKTRLDALETLVERIDKEFYVSPEAETLKGRVTLTKNPNNDDLLLGSDKLGGY